MTEPEDRPRTVRPMVPALALVGAGLMIVGAFCPAVVLGSGETLSYREFADTDGNVVLAVAAATFLLTWVFRWYRGLFATSGVALFMIGATVLKVPRSGQAGASLAWAWLPLVAGAVLPLAAALLAEKDRPAADAEQEAAEDEEVPEEPA